MPVRLIEAFKEKFGVQVIDGYGLTEACGVSTTGSGLPPNWASIGMAFPAHRQDPETSVEENRMTP